MVSSKCDGCWPGLVECYSKELNRQRVPLASDCPLTRHSQRQFLRLDCMCSCFSAGNSTILAVFKFLWRVQTFLIHLCTCCSIILPPTVPLVHKGKTPSYQLLWSANESTERESPLLPMMVTVRVHSGKTPCYQLWSPNESTQRENPTVRVHKGNFVVTH